jgi:hypothetical protein
MKLTWFGSTAIRIHIGGSILVADPANAPAHVDHAELISGADRVFETAGPARALPEIDPSQWHRRKPPRPLDEGDWPSQPVDVLRIGPGAVLVEAVGEPYLVLVTGAAPRFGRWADDAVIVLFGSGVETAATGTALLDVARPRLIALADEHDTIDSAIDALREHLDGAALIALEPGMAVEI